MAAHAATLVACSVMASRPLAVVALLVGCVAYDYYRVRLRQAFDPAEATAYIIDWSVISRRRCLLHVTPHVENTIMSPWAPANGERVLARDVPETPYYVQLLNGYYVERRTCGVELMRPVNADAHDTPSTTTPSQQQQQQQQKSAAATTASAPCRFAAERARILDDLRHQRNDKSIAGRVDAQIAELVHTLNERTGGRYVTTSSCSGRVSLFHRAAATAVAAAEASGGGDADALRRRKRGSAGRGIVFESHDALADVAHAVDAHLLPAMRDVAAMTRRGAHATASLPHDNNNDNDNSGSSSHDDDDATSLRHCELLQLKFEPMIVHVLCADIDAAARLLQCAREAAQLRSSILSCSPYTASSTRQPHVQRRVVCAVTSPVSFDIPLYSNGRWLLGSNSVGGGGDHKDDDDDEAHTRDAWHALLCTALAHANVLFAENARRTRRFAEQTEVVVMPLVSWQQYDDEHQLSEVLTAAARACVAARVRQPSEFLATYFTAVTRGDAVDALTCCPVVTMHGAGFVVRVRLCTLAEGEARALSSSSSSARETMCGYGDAERGSDMSSGSHGGGSGGAGVAACRARLCAAVCAHVQQHVIPALLRVGVCEQQRWDATVAQALPHDATAWPSRRLSSALCFAFSLAASLAAARTRRVALHDYYRTLYLQSNNDNNNNSNNNTTNKNDKARQVCTTSTAHNSHATRTRADAAYVYTPPQVLLPFFGRALSSSARSGSATAATTAAAAGTGNSADGGSAAAYATPPGTVCVHTVYLIPVACANALSATTTTTPPVAAAPVSMTRGRDKPRASTTAQTPHARKLSVAAAAAAAAMADDGRDDKTSVTHTATAAAAVSGLTSDALARLLTAYQRFRARHPECAVRRDGAFVYDSLENISNAVHVCADVLADAGLVLGTDVLLGVRIDCPVVTAAAASSAAATANTTTTTTPEPATGTRGASNKATAAATAAAATAAGSDSSRNHTRVHTATGGKPASKSSRAASAATTPQQQQQQQLNGSSSSRSTVMYTLFPGDPDITSAQMTEYVKQQVAACEGALVFVEDTHAAQRGVMRNAHNDDNDNDNKQTLADDDDSDDSSSNDDDDDVVSVRRLQRAIGDRVVVSHRVRVCAVADDDDDDDNDNDNSDNDGARTTTTATAAVADVAARVRDSVRRALTMHVTVDPVTLGSVSAFMTLCRRVEAHGGGVSVACARADGDVCALVELALGVGARYLDVGGLNLPSACEALSHYAALLQQLQCAHALAPCQAHALSPAMRARLQRRLGSRAADDDDVDDNGWAVTVPEIRRRGDKKRKKPSKH